VPDEIKCLFLYSILGGYCGFSSIDYTYCYWPAMVFVQSNRITITKSINAEETVRQARRASATKKRS